MAQKHEILNITEGSDFQYLLELLIPLYKEPEFAWLPELFSIVGYESLIRLCKYAGGESIKVPTLVQLSDAVNALDWYYKVWISKKAKVTDIPPQLNELVNKIVAIYNDRNRNAEAANYEN